MRPANSHTRQSASNDTQRGGWSGRRASNAFSPAFPSAIPISPPSADNIRLSRTINRDSRQRVAPSDSRRPSSRPRDSPRASIKAATFPQAITSTIATAKSNNWRISRVPPK